MRFICSFWYVEFYIFKKWYLVSAKITIFDFLVQQTRNFFLTRESTYLKILLARKLDKKSGIFDYSEHSEFSKQFCLS